MQLELGGALAEDGVAGAQEGAVVELARGWPMQGHFVDDSTWGFDPPGLDPVSCLRLHPLGDDDRKSGPFVTLPAVGHALGLGVFWRRPRLVANVDGFEFLGAAVGHYIGAKQ